MNDAIIALTALLQHRQVKPEACGFEVRQTQGTGYIQLDPTSNPTGITITGSVSNGPPILEQCTRLYNKTANPHRKPRESDQLNLSIGSRTGSACCGEHLAEHALTSPVIGRGANTPASEMAC